MIGSLCENFDRNLALRCGDGKDELLLLQVLNRQSFRILTTSSIWSSLKYMESDIARNREFYSLFSVLNTLVKLLELSSWSNVFNYFCIQMIIVIHVIPYYKIFRFINNRYFQRNIIFFWYQTHIAHDELSKTWIVIFWDWNRMRSSPNWLHEFQIIVYVHPCWSGLYIFWLNFRLQ